MIELLFMLCIPVTFGYDCDWDIQYVEWKDTLDYIYNMSKADRQPPPDPRMVGLTLHGPKIIYILVDRDLDWVLLGCTVIWHEILHAMGYEHEEMKMCKWKPQPKSPNSFPVIIP